MARFTSYGVCALCGRHTSKAGMTRHLKTCPANHDASRGEPARLLRLRAEDAWTPFFWMDLEMKAGAKLEDLDKFLRDTWLECCGHLSAFYVEGDAYMPPGFADPGERSMRTRLGDALSSDARFEHVYDFGTSTELSLRVTGEREGSIGSESLRVLSRNDAPVWACEVCGEEAAFICQICMYETANPFYCQTHADDHDCEEPDMLLPVVNSPRMGMCGYEG